MKTNASEPMSQSQSSTDDRESMMLTSPIRSPLRNSNSRTNRNSARKEVLSYPKASIPSRNVVQMLYDETSSELQDDEDKAVASAGLLSFEKVLLPAAAYQEYRSLKKYQSIVQRDFPDQTSRVVACRKEVYDSLRVAVEAAQNSRRERQKAREELYQKLQQRDALAQEEWNSVQEMNRQKRLTQLRKHFPRNQELWREVAFLITETSKLQQEERLWNQADKMLDELIQKNGNNSSNHRGSPEIVVEAEAEQVQNLTQMVQDMELSASQLQQAVRHVNQVMDNCNHIRRELYHSYRQDHQFHGYPGVNDAKGLLMALSQD